MEEIWVQEGPIYWCKSCENFLSYEVVCPKCNKPGEEIGFMRSSDEQDM